MVKECQCACKEMNGPKEWKGLTKFRIAELDVLRGYPGHTSIEFIMAKDTTDAIEKYYKNFQGSSNRILVYPEGCGTIHARQESGKSRDQGKPMYPSSEAADDALAH